MSLAGPFLFVCPARMALFVCSFWPCFQNYLTGALCERWGLPKLTNGTQRTEIAATLAVFAIAIPIPCPCFIGEEFLVFSPCDYSFFLFECFPFPEDLFSTN